MAAEVIDGAMPVLASEESAGRRQGAGAETAAPPAVEKERASPRGTTGRRRRNQSVHVTYSPHAQP